VPWKCSNCGYTINEKAYPERCPSCQEACAFIDVTCYIPDCGGPNPDLMDERIGRKEKEQ